MAYGIHSRNRLQDRVESSFDRIGNHRSAREKIWKAYVGDTHGLSGAAANANRIPLNGHALYARVLIQYLAANQPKLLISTDVGPWKQYLENIEFQASRVMKAERFGFKQQRFVLDALLYSPGIMKVVQEWRRSPLPDGSYTELLQTAISNIDPSDWVFDTAASSVYDAAFTGHRVRMPVDDIVDNPMFADIDRDTLMGLSGRTFGDDERLFFEDDDKSQPYKECVTLWEIWDRCDNRIKIWPVDNSSLMLYDEPWEGHVNGPLHYLDFLDVPNHVVGLSPLCILHNLIEASNRALSKSIAQTDAAKTIMRTTSSNKGEAEAIMQALDGTAVYADSGVVEMLTVGGPDARTLSMVPVLRDLYNWVGGNINELGGLGVSAPTATQGKLLTQAASGMVTFMQSRTNEAVRAIAEAIVQNELQDQVTTEVIPIQLAGGQTTWRKFTPEQRSQIDAVLLNIDIDVYSMGYQSPEQRLGRLMEWWNGFAVPGYPMWQQQGGDFDIQALNRTYAKLANLPEINDVALYSMRPQPQTTGSSPIQPRQSPVTTRTNVRMDGSNRQPELGGDMAKSLLQLEAA